MQCSQANLQDIGADCALPLSVPCADQKIAGMGKSFCFTRQIINQKGKEKF